MDLDNDGFVRMFLVEPGPRGRTVRAVKIRAKDHVLRKNLGMEEGAPMDTMYPRDSLPGHGLRCLEDSRKSTEKKSWTMKGLEDFPIRGSALIYGVTKSEISDVRATIQEVQAAVGA